MVKPLSAQGALALLVLIAPYVPALVAYFNELAEAVKRREIISATLRALTEPLKQFPEDFAAIMALLLGRSPEWIMERGLTAQQLLEALPALDELNDFKNLLQSGYRLGLLRRDDGRR